MVVDLSAAGWMKRASLLCLQSASLRVGIGLTQQWIPTYVCGISWTDWMSCYISQRFYSILHIRHPQSADMPVFNQ